eukprot:jgi/Mesen1/909/ME000116S00051
MENSIAATRSKRQRAAPNYVKMAAGNYNDDDEDDGDGMYAQRNVRQKLSVVDHGKHSHKNMLKAVLGFKESEKDTNRKAGGLAVVEASELMEFIGESGLQSAILVKRSYSSSEDLGVRLPNVDFTVDEIAELMGGSAEITTLDSTTKEEGMIYTMDEWRQYWSEPSPRQPLLSMPALDLTHTPLHTMVSGPRAAEVLSLVAKVWPDADESRPEAPTNLAMSVAGCVSDFQVAPSGASAWFHLISGKQVCLIAAPIARNVRAFENWLRVGREVGGSAATLLYLSLCLSLRHTHTHTQPHSLTQRDLHTHAHWLVNFY